MKRSSKAVLTSTLMLCMMGGASQVQAADTLAKIKATGKIVIGHRESSDPISYVVAGKPVGYAIDICNNVANEIKKNSKCQTLRLSIRQSHLQPEFLSYWQEILTWNVVQPPILYNVSNKSVFQRTTMQQKFAWQ
jgi:glutamate/aspartate transport system substrate-binding protein